MLSVLLGGFLAIIGGIVGQSWTQHLKQKREDKNLRLDKAERLLESLYAHSSWLEEKRFRLFSQQADPYTPSPLSKAMMLQNLYFPELKELMFPVLEADQAIVDLLDGQRIEQLKDMSGWLEKVDLKEFRQLNRQYIAAFCSYEERLRTMVEEHAKS